MLGLASLRRINPTLPLVTAAHFTHHMATGALVPVLPFLRDEFGLDYFRSGLIISAYNVVDGASQVPMGRLADRVDKRLLLSIGLGTVALAAMAIGLANSYYMLIALLMLLGILSGMHHPAGAAILMEHYPKSRARALGINMLGSANFLVTYPLAAFIAYAAGWRWAFPLLALPSLPTALIFWQMMRRRVPEAVAEPAPRAGPSLPFWQAIRPIGLILSIFIISRLLIAGTIPLLSLYLVDKHGMAPALAGSLVGLVYGSAIVAGPLGGAIADRLGSKPVFLFCVAILGPLLFLITLAPSPLAVLTILIFMGLAIQGKSGPLQSLVAGAVPREQRATMLGVYFFLGAETGGLATPLAGFLMQWLGLDEALTVLALAATAFSAIILLVLKRIL